MTKSNKAVFWLFAVAGAILAVLWVASRTETKGDPIPGIREVVPPVIHPYNACIDDGICDGKG